jgi:hypothetical protein
MFSSWLQARAAKDPALQAMLVRRFSPEYRAAFTAWLATDPFTNPDAPPGPGYMPEYHNPQIEQANQRFRLSGVRLAVLAIALTLLAYALYDVVTLPRL